MLLVDLRCAVNLPEADFERVPPLVAMHWGATAEVVRTDQGERGAAARQHFTLHRVERARLSDVHVRVRVPSRTQRLAEVRGSIPLYDAREAPVQIRFDDITHAAGTTQEAGGYDVTITGVEQKGETLTIRTLVGMPEVTKGEPLYWPSALLTRQVRCTDGTVLESHGGSGGGTKTGHFRYTTHFPLAGKKPAALVVTAVPGIVERNLPFSLKNVRLPARPEPAQQKAVPRGPRGPSEVRSEGFVFTLKTIRVERQASEHRQSGKLELQVAARGPKDLEGLVASGGVFKPQARDDRSRPVKPRRYFPHYAPPSRGHLARASFHFTLPPNDADRLVELAGEYALLFAEAYEEAGFALPDGDFRLADAPERAGVTLRLATMRGGHFHAEWELPKERFPSPAYGWSAALRFILLDRAGNALARQRPGFGDGRYNADCALQGKVAPARLIIRYPSKGRERRIPFRFENVGLPREAGVKQFEVDIF